MNKQQRFSRRSIILFWLALVAVIIGTLIALEQIAILYVLATVALVALLLVVAFADLEKVGSEGSGAFSQDVN
ncbi:MAG: hypothetical protein IT173_15125 [Acidobacteria bacterium]|nr:hypothetical protein [Acidobacteriota bacterium]